jgi:hypothetical protein
VTIFILFLTISDNFRTILFYQDKSDILMIKKAIRI